MKPALKLGATQGATQRDEEREWKLEDKIRYQASGGRPSRRALGAGASQADRRNRTDRPNPQTPPHQPRGPMCVGWAAARQRGGGAHRAA